MLTENRLSHDLNLIAVIDHSGRSGNGFFMTIFDQHEEVLGCPLLHYTYSYLESLFSNRKNISPQEAHSYWTSTYYFHLLYHDRDPTRDDLIIKFGGDPAMDLNRPLLRKIFDEMILNLKTVTRKDIIIGMFTAYASATGRDLSKVRHLLVSDSISLRHEDVLKGFSGKVIEGHAPRLA